MVTATYGRRVVRVYNSQRSRPVGRSGGLREPRVTLPMRRPRDIPNLVIAAQCELGRSFNALRFVRFRHARSS